MNEGKCGIIKETFFKQERRAYQKAGSEAWHVSLTVSSLALHT